MSTNYYMRNKKEYQEWLEKESWIHNIIQEAIEKLKPLDLNRYTLDSIENKIYNEFCHEHSYDKYDEIHIGKYSSGFFKFEVNERFYRALKDEFYKWLDDNKEEYEIYNEYDEILVVDEMKVIIDNAMYGEKWVNYKFS